MTLPQVRQRLFRSQTWPRRREGLFGRRKGAAATVPSGSVRVDGENGLEAVRRETC